MAVRKISKLLAGIEDLFLGNSTVQQTRHSGTHTITAIGGASLPFDAAGGDTIKVTFDNHLADPIDAHDAGAISVASAGVWFAGTDVETVLHEIDAALDLVGLQYFIEARNTSAPNTTVPVHSFTVDGIETDIDIALVPKGAGAITVQIADGTALGGEKRGDYAVDLQHERTNSAEVASGFYSVLSGGYDNLVSNWAAVIAGGYNNQATGHTSVIGGGAYNIADGYFSTIPGGNRATARGLFGKYVYASGMFTTEGDAQYSKQVLRLITTDATPQKPGANGVQASSSNAPGIPDNHAYLVTAKVIAREAATGDVASWEIKGAVKRGTGAASTALIGTPTKTVLAKDTGAALWDVDLVADTVYGTVNVQLTGEVGKTLHWVSTIDTVEVG